MEATDSKARPSTRLCRRCRALLSAAMMTVHCKQLSKQAATRVEVGASGPPAAAERQVSGAPMPLMCNFRPSLRTVLASCVLASVPTTWMCAR